MNTNFYVYLHRRLSDGTVFYVGKGQGRRAYVKSGRSERWKRTADKYGYSVEIVFDKLTEEEAFQVEIDTILEFTYFGYNLCNLTSGGEGVSGYKVSEAHKQKMSKFMTGKPKSKQAIEKCRLAQVGKAKSAEQKLKNSISHLGNQSRKDKKEYIFFSDTDIFIGTRSELSSTYQIPPECVRNLFKTRTQKTAHGWRVLSPAALITLSNILTFEGK